MKVRIGSCKYCNGDLFLRRHTSQDIYWQCLQCGRIVDNEVKSKDKVVEV